MSEQPAPASTGLKLYVLAVAVILLVIVGWFMYELGRKDQNRKLWDERHAANSNMSK